MSSQNYYEIELNICGALATTGAYAPSHAAAIRHVVKVEESKILKQVAVKNVGDSDDWSWMEEASVRACLYSYDHVKRGHTYGEWIYYRIVKAPKPINFDKETGKIILPENMRDMHDFVETHIQNRFELYRYQIWLEVMVEVDAHNDCCEIEKKPFITNQMADRIYERVCDDETICFEKVASEAIQLIMQSEMWGKKREGMETD